MTKTIQTGEGEHYLDDEQQWIDLYAMLEVEIDGNVIKIKRRSTHDRVNLPNSLGRINRNLRRHVSGEEGEIIYAYDPRDFPASGNTTKYFKEGGLWIPEENRKKNDSEFKLGTLEYKACEALQIAARLFPNIIDALNVAYKSYKR